MGDATLAQKALATVKESKNMENGVEPNLID
jgi:hypothetical protein